MDDGVNVFVIINLGKKRSDAEVKLECLLMECRSSNV